ncbi:hypothetical protein [Methylibium petroleiphilum]|uniref:hypothetical protein n=2 Tax=Methylibium petroleiphilum TaxID=105560 RepID=UPI003D28E77C
MLMIGVDKSLLRHLLLVDGPWEIGDYQLDLRKRRCDVWIGPQVERGWFGRPKKGVPVRLQQHMWQHLSLGPVRFFLHVSIPSTSEVDKLPWMGDPGMPFTTALAQQVFAFFNEGVSLQAICSLMKLSLNDVWRYRFALDNGRAQVQAAANPAPPARTDTAHAATPPAAVAATLPNATPDATGDVPDVTDPIWLRLANGDLQLDIRVLSLKLMLTRVRSQLDLISDDEVRLLKLRDLHRYFVKNERVLSHELAQLKLG